MTRLSFAILIAAVGCGGGQSIHANDSPARADFNDDALVTTSWIHGSADCSSDGNPPLQIVRIDDDTYVLRQNKCVNYEAPFLYLLFGSDRALIEDTGATRSASAFPVGATVLGLVHDWAAAHGKSDYPLVVAHTHAHGDHVLGDAQLRGQPGVTLVEPRLDAVTQFFGFDDWPATARTFELGGRTLEVLPIPGHEATHIAIFDPHTGWLLTGDTLYPGRLYIADWDAYRASVARLAAFAHARPVTRVLGTHIELSKAAGVDYPIGSTFQPDEHALPLTVGTLDELQHACDALGDEPRRDVHADFIVYPF